MFRSVFKVLFPKEFCILNNAYCETILIFVQRGAFTSGPKSHCLSQGVCLHSTFISRRHVSLNCLPGSTNRTIIFMHLFWHHWLWYFSSRIPHLSSLLISQVHEHRQRTHTQTTLTYSNVFYITPLALYTPSPSSLSSLQFLVFRLSVGPSKDLFAFCADFLNLLHPKILEMIFVNHNDKPQKM